MKYMGSKTFLLRNGLGELLVREAHKSARFVDLFSGSGAVAWHVAERAPIPVLANDLQMYSAVLAEAVLLRTAATTYKPILMTWLRRARQRHAELADGGILKNAVELTDEASVYAARDLCANSSGGPIWAAYGGYYYSPSQAAAFDCLLQTLPKRRPERALCLAAVISTASRCAASPGHTAQPFTPSPRSMRFIHDAWLKDPFLYADQEAQFLAAKRSLCEGEARVADANTLVEELDEHDLVFVDPPYSSAQYSRFYHVLETVADGRRVEVSGAGRYPPSSDRPKSAYSLSSRATAALYFLIERLAEKRCNTVLTFPQFMGSNGVTGEQIVAYSRRWFHVDVRTVPTSLSTLGGNNAIRASRRHSTELVLHLQPKHI